VRALTCLPLTFVKEPAIGMKLESAIILERASNSAYLALRRLWLRVFQHFAKFVGVNDDPPPLTRYHFRTVKLI
jgi:hypothetical protein